MTEERTPLVSDIENNAITTTPWYQRATEWVKTKAKALKREVVTLYIASSDARVPLMTKIICALVLAMALSPIDLIPDFIPILGLLDDIVLIPLGLWLAIRLIPSQVWTDARVAAIEHEEREGGRLPPNYYAATVVILLWIIGCVWLLRAVFAWRNAAK